MHHDRIARADLVQGLQRLAARHHVIFADDLEPVDRRMAELGSRHSAGDEARGRSRGKAACAALCAHGRGDAAKIGLLATFMPAPLRRPISDTKLSRNRGPAYRAPAPREDRTSGRSELALGGSALLLGHGREALTLAGVLALAGVRGALTRALALAGVGAHALAVGGVGHGGETVAVARNSVAAAAAITAPDLVVTFMRISSKKS